MPARQMAKRCIIAMLLLFSCLLLFAGCTPAGEEGTSTPQDGSVEDAAAAGDSAEEAGTDSDRQPGRGAGVQRRTTVCCLLASFIG